jgi:hypothetical protein
MPHDLAFVSATEAEALFQCNNCTRTVSFVLPGLGEPAAVADGESWAAPENASDYMDVCETPITPPVVVPEFISKRQFLIQLLRAGMVTAEEVPTLAVHPPALLAPAIAGMTSEQQLELTLTWASMTVIERYGELTMAAAASAGTTEAQLDEFFIAAGAI